jgi:signal transduction histidine kinase
MEAIKEKNIKNGVIKISTKYDNNNFVIIVEDNGVGIDKKTMEEIYEPFYTTKLNGTGLGVSFCKEVIEEHDGTINYISEEGKWTKVIINLKIKNSA